MIEEKVLSSFFSQSNSNLEKNEDNIEESFLHLIDELNESLKDITLPTKVECIYNPTIYAREPFEIYIRKYCNNKKEIMYFGMNPGPWGMSQTGVPFGEINMVRNWLCIEGPVGKPPIELQSRPVKGFECTRTEISGKRFWGLFKNLCGTPERFFKTSFVYNYLPQQWMKNSGCNITPGDFKTSEMQELYNVCDLIFIKTLELYDVKIIVAIGKFCENRAKKAIKKYLPMREFTIVYLPHPSPRTVNNNEWEQKAPEYLRKLNLLHYYTYGDTTNT